ncbi:MAG: hypothetical protein PHD95_07240, partial [Candidatus ainarchaeum sp.]|nr:hypothetical protein [Candidatus ainarchaeum sp.]
QNFYFIRIVGSLAIIIGFALLINSVINAADSWRALKDYPTCMNSINADLPEYSQMRLSYCQDSFYNLTGVQLQTNSPLGNSQRVQVLLNSIIKIFFGIAVIFFGIWLYRPFPTVARVQQWPHKVQVHRKR